ncbi:Chloroplastic lipocalin [Thalictrum thalictroides]|uniref:Chloroplastic lipocalin n=1 Tax=Thalictrum thalictroides TaxID=46969 RepID=A0A7J6VC86_THATH|nr:Chloroplastic lipocalin [Thalictrum thalictroides]
MLIQASSSLSSSSSSPIKRKARKRTVKCSLQHPASNIKSVSRHIVSGLAVSLLFIPQINQVNAEELSHYSNVCQLAAVTNSNVPLKIDDGSDEGNGKLMMMRGMSAKNFDPVRYSGRWFEVASLKGGFAGQGQEDCHCTQVSAIKRYIRLNILLLVTSSSQDKKKGRVGISLTFCRG